MFALTETELTTLVTDGGIVTRALLVMLMTEGDSRLEPEANGLLPLCCQSLDEFHCARYQSGLVELPKFWKTYLNCSPFGPDDIAPFGVFDTL